MLGLQGDEFISHRGLFDLGPDDILLGSQATGVANLGNFFQAEHQVENFLGQAFISHQIVELRVGCLYFGGDLALCAVGTPFGTFRLEFGNLTLQVTLAEPGDVLHQRVARAADAAGGQ